MPGRCLLPHHQFIVVNKDTQAYFHKRLKFYVAFIKISLYNDFVDALVAEQVDAADLKSVDRKVVPVRFRPSAPNILLEYQALNFRAEAFMLWLFNFLNLCKTSAYTFLEVKTNSGEQNV